MLNKRATLCYVPITNIFPKVNILGTNIAIYSDLRHII